MSRKSEVPKIKKQQGCERRTKRDLRADLFWPDAEASSLRRKIRTAKSRKQDRVQYQSVWQKLLPWAKVRVEKMEEDPKIQIWKDFKQGADQKPEERSWSSRRGPEEWEWREGPRKATKVRCNREKRARWYEVDEEERKLDQKFFWVAQFGVHHLKSVGFQSLGTLQGVDENMKAFDERMKGVDGRTKGVDRRMKGVDRRMKGVDMLCWNVSLVESLRVSPRGFLKGLLKGL